MRTVALALVLCAITATTARAQDDDPFAAGSFADGPFADGSFADGPSADGEVAAVPVLTDLSPRDTQVLLGQDLVRQGYRTLGEALAQVAGFSRERTSRGYRYALRGVPAGVLLVVDDVPQVVDGQRDVLDVDDLVSLVDVDRVEIVRGPVTALHGAGALVGVVRIITVKPGLTGGSARAAGSWLASGLPLFGEQDVSGAATARVGGAGVRVSGSVRRGAPELWRLRGVPVRYQTVGGATLPVTKENLDVSVDEDSETVRAVGQWSDFVADASVAHGVSRQPVSAFSHGLVADDPQTATRDVERARLLWQRWLGPVHLEAAGWVAHEERSDDGPLYPTRGIFEDGGALNVDERTDTAGALVRVDVPLSRDHRLVAAAFGDGTGLTAHSDSRDPRNGSVLPDTVSLDDTTGTAAAALEWQGDFGLGLHATAGVAAELRTAFPLSLSPRAALSWTPGDVALRASYAEGTRAPDLYDVTALAQTVVDGRVAGAGPADDLRPEHVRTLELSSSWSPSPRLRLDARAYGLRHEDALADVVKGGLLVPKNLAARIVVGGELTGAVQPFGDALSLEGALAGARTVFGPSVDEDLAQAVAGVRVSPFSGVSAGVRGRAVLRSAGQSALVDAWCALFPFGDTLGLTASVRNVLDGDEPSVDRFAPPQADPLLLPSPGRVVTLAVEAHL